MDNRITYSQISNFGQNQDAQRGQAVVDISDAFSKVSQYINSNDNNKFQNSEISALFEQIQQQIKNDQEIEKKTNQNIMIVNQNKIQPTANNNAQQGVTKDNGGGGLAVVEWNSLLSSFLLVLKQHLIDNDVKLEFLLSKNDIPHAEHSNKLYGWLLLLLNDQNNYKYCVTFENFSESLEKLKSAKNSLGYLCDLVQSCAQSVSGTPPKIKKEQIIILAVEQPNGKPKDIEVHFNIREENMNQSLLEIPKEALANEIKEHMKKSLTATNIKVTLKKIMKRVTLPYDYFLREYSRNWDSLEGQVDTRGIKNGEAQTYYFPISWTGIAIDVTNYAEDQHWLSMSADSTKAWPVAYLPGKSKPVDSKDRIKYAISKDKFSGNDCGSGITLYRKPEDAEAKSDIIEEPITNCKWKIIYLCRVSLDNLKCPISNTNVYIMNGLRDVRPYRILFKKMK